MLPLCLGAALLAHLALLGAGAEAVHRWQQERLHAKPVATPAALLVRHLASAAVGEASPEASGETTMVTDAALGSDAVPDQVAAEPAVAAASAVEPAIYVPRAMLSTAPVPRTPVMLVWPQNWPLKASYTAILKLYLDEQGEVERVEQDGDTRLPEPLFESARQAFISAGFTPGQLNGQAVKSWVRVEVNFESDKLPVRP